MQSFPHTAIFHWIVQISKPNYTVNIIVHQNKIALHQNDFIQAMCNSRFKQSEFVHPDTKPYGSGNSKFTTLICPRNPYSCIGE